MTISTRFKGETIDLHTTEYAVPFSNPLAVTAWKREADEMYDCCLLYTSDAADE